ncbi:uncharacterized protein LOC124594337 [Schistocerca americana]|uniref:uncharacterized protein LOC124594337 n=1 Tax=Schistocerca americana TaxID=7009 RepID=UPI001F4FED9D|nr:uncharacterized protein LOC124594337 [Schistocerca americana]
MSETWGEPDDDWGSGSAATPLLAALSLWCCGGVLAALTCSPLRRAPWRPLLLLWAAAEMLLQLQVLAGWITLKVSQGPEASAAGCGLHHLLSHAAGLALAWAAALLGLDRLAARRRPRAYARSGGRAARWAAAAAGAGAGALFLPLAALPAPHYWHGRFACQLRAPHPWPRLLDALLDAYLVLAVLLPPLAAALCLCLAAARCSWPPRAASDADADADEYGSLTPFLATYCVLAAPSVAFAVWVLLIEHADVEVEEAWAVALSWLLGATQYASLCRGPLLAAALAAGPQFRRAVRAALAPRPRLAPGPDNHVLLVNMNEEEDNT